MNSGDANFFHTALDPEYFESLNAYRPTGEYRTVVEALLGDGWVMAPAGYWTQCGPADGRVGVQGWKIHLSAVPGTAVEMLQRAVPVLVEAGVPFKFVSDPRMLVFSTSKNAGRSSAGKFITVYPADEAAFVSLVDRCHRATEGMRGPYLLTDRPYADSKVVFYRYGEHRGTPRTDETGQVRRMLVAPDGTEVEDDRRPCFWLPDWVRDPFAGDEPPAAPATEVVLSGRYRVTGAVRYSAVGGLYRAEDTATGREVLVREARPMLIDRGADGDARLLLEKEARILQAMEETGLTPAYVDLFREWEHSFLVSEWLEARTIWFHSLDQSKALHPALSPPAGELFDKIRANFRQVAEGVEAFHARGIVLRDLTKSNVLVTHDGRVKFIDFELAFELDRDDPLLGGGTAGYMSPEQRRNARPTPADDHFQLGVLLLDLVAYNAPAFGLNPEGACATLALMLDDLGLPGVLLDVVRGLTEADPARRWTPAQALAALDAVGALPASPPPPPMGGIVASRPAPAAALTAEARDAVAGAAEFILHIADHARTDRLYPASPDVYRSHPVGVQFGAAGPAWFLHRCGVEVPEETFAWIDAAWRRSAVPPSLYNGLAGVALFLLDAGRVEAADEVMEEAWSAGAGLRAAELFHGRAGLGLAALHFWSRGRGEAWLGRAQEAGEAVLRSARSHPAGAYWENAGKVEMGLGHGQSGVALFLAYLNAAAPAPEWLALAEKAIGFDAAHAVGDDGLLLWPENPGQTTGPRMPHLRYGSAGVGMAALRVWTATGDPRYRGLADACAETVSGRHSNKLWRDFGLAGYGELLVDLHRYTGEARYLDAAWYLVPAILANRIPRAAGIAFPGLHQVRISCDVGMGSAGIGLFLQRVLDPSLPDVLLPDWLLDPRGNAAPAAEEERAPAVLAVTS